MLKEPYVSKYYKVADFDCFRRNQNEYAFTDEKTGMLATYFEDTANLFKILDLANSWRENAGLSNFWVINTTNAGYKSGFRTVEVNAEVGGVSNSDHLKGRAVDCHIAGQDDTDYNLRDTLIASAKSFGLENKIAIGMYGDWIHISVRGEQETYTEW